MGKVSRARGVFGWALLTAVAVGTGWAVGEIGPEEPKAIVEEPGTAGDFRSAVEQYLAMWQQYVEGQEYPDALDAALMKLVARAFRDTPRLAPVVQRTDGLVRWCEMSSGAEDEPLPDDKLVNRMEPGYFVGAVVFDTEARPAVFYRTLKLKAGGEVTVFQNSLALQVMQGANIASRHRGDLYAVVVSGGHSRMAMVSARRDRYFTSWTEPLHLLDAFDTTEAGPVLAYMYGPVGNGRYAYLTLRTWDEPSGTWREMGRHDWDDVSVEYDAASHRLTVTELNSARWGGSGVEEPRSYDLQQLVKDAVKGSEENGR